MHEALRVTAREAEVIKMIHLEPTRDARALAQLNQSVQALHHELYPSEFKPFDLSETEEAFKKMLATSDAFAFLASDSEKAIGYLLGFVKTRKENAFQFAKTVLNIDQICVDPEYRNRGIAQQLLEKALELANQKGITEIQLDHWEGNTAAGKFFAKHGFKYFNHRMKRMIDQGNGYF